MNLHTDQATLDTWRTTGSWVLFGEGELPYGDPCPCGRTEHPPAWMTEAAKPCETCGGKAKVPGMYHGPADLLFACPDCDDGRQRHTITVPCDECPCPSCGRGAYDFDPDAWHGCTFCKDEPCERCIDDHITVPELAIVEWGALVVEGFGYDGVDYVRLSDGTKVSVPDEDAAEFVGQFAIGGKLVSASS